MPDLNDETKPTTEKFDFAAFPDDTLFYERRDGAERRGIGGHARGPAPPPRPPRAPGERREKKERRRRIDPTTFEKQYTDDEIEFMTAMQHFKVQSGKGFPTYGEVLRVALGMGYRKVVYEESGDAEGEFDLDSGEELSS